MNTIIPDLDNTRKIIEEHCRNEWPNDFNMRLHCIEDQEKALNKINNLKFEGIDQKVINQIFNKAQKDWPTDFEMQLVEINEQIEAYKKLKNHT